MTSPKIEAVAFDMDGLIFNTEDLYDQVGQILMQRRGKNFTRELKLAMMGLPGPVAFEVMRERGGVEDSAQDLQDEADAVFVDLLPSEIKTMPGLETLLCRLEELNIPKAVATSSHREFAKTALGMFDLEPRFQFVLTSEDVTEGKPNPEIYLSAARRLGVEPSKMLVLEDSVTGSKAGVAAGAVTIAVPTLHSRGMDFSHVYRVAERLDDHLIMGIWESD